MVASGWDQGLVISYAGRAGSYVVCFPGHVIHASSMKDLREQVALYVSARLGKSYDLMYDTIEFKGKS